MREKFRLVIENPLFSGSTIMVVGSNIVNIMNYLYHFAMGRLLGVAAYGELVALISFISLLSMVPMAFSMVITKFVSAAKTKESIQGFLYVFYKYIVALCLLIGFSLFFLMPAIGTFFNISHTTLIIEAILIIVIALPLMINRATLQGLLRFGSLISALFIENIVKLLLGLYLVFLGFSVSGALGGVIVGGVVSFIISYYFIRDYPPLSTYKPSSIKPLIVYSLPVFFNFIAITLFSNSDLLLVKHYFSAEQAGTYAAAAVLSKVIFFGVSPIVSVMFPIISKRHSEKVPFYSVFLFTLSIVSLLCVCAIFGYTFLSGLVIWLLYGKIYLASGALLGYFSIYVSLFSLATVFTSFFLAIGDKKAVTLFVFAAFLQIIGIVFYHSSLVSVLMVSIIISSLLLVALIVYSIYERKNYLGYSSSISSGKDNRKRSKKNT